MCNVLIYFTCYLIHTLVYKSAKQHFYQKQYIKIIKKFIDLTKLMYCLCTTNTCNYNTCSLTVVSAAVTAVVGMCLGAVFVG